MKHLFAFVGAVSLSLAGLQTAADAQPLGACEGVLPDHYHPVNIGNALIDSIDVWYETTYVAGQQPHNKWRAAMLGTTVDAVLTGPCHVSFFFTRPPNPIWYRLTVSAMPKRGVIFLHGTRGECVWGPAYTDCSPVPTLPRVAEYLTW